MSDTGHDNLLWAWTLIDSLAASGVAHAVISPGSRSTPLALACLRHQRLKTWIQVDERCAAFFALGLAKAENRPVALICTSGSAPANWFPAVIEADMGATPLILLTADRPPELRGCGANQAIDQIKLFGGHIRGFHELPCADGSTGMQHWLRSLAAQAASQSRWPLPGPVHVNVPLREPLLPSGPFPAWPAGITTTVDYPVMSLAAPEADNLAQELYTGRGMIVCGEGDYGDGFPAAVTALAHKVACPILADPLSNLRFGNHNTASILTRYDAFLRHTSVLDKLRPDWVLRFGTMPVSKSLQSFLEAPSGVTQWIVDDVGRWPDPTHRATHMIRADAAVLCQQLSAWPGGSAPASWLSAFIAEEARAAHLASLNTPPEAEVIQTIIDRMPPGSIMFCGNSMAIRDLDAYSGRGNNALNILGNRGASGIDGNVSTALGIAAGSGKPVLALLGDLAFYHDMNGLAAARDLDIVFVILNNGGGGIFSYLPQAGLEEFDHAWLTPLNLDFSNAATMYGLSYYKPTKTADLRSALDVALNGGAHLVEVVLNRETSVIQHRAYWAALADSA